MRIAVIGPGAVGTLFGGLLANGGHDTWLLHHREDEAAEINERGVRIDDGEGDAPTIHADVTATADAASVGPVDLALVLVRAHQTIDAVTDHAACIGPDTHVLSLQNGVTNHYRLRDHVGPERTLSGITRQGGSVQSPGHVVRTGDGTTVLGGEDAAFAEEVAEAFEAADIETQVVEDPFYYIWEKQLWGGSIKPVAALTRLPNRELVADDAIAAIMEQLVLEMGEVAAAEGIEIDAEAIWDDVSTSLRTSTHKSSMLQDVENERKTEIDDCNGAIVDFADEAGIDVPYNRTLTSLVRGLERSYRD